MRNEHTVPEALCFFVKQLGIVDLGPEIVGMEGSQLRMRMVTFEPDSA